MTPMNLTRLKNLTANRDAYRYHTPTDGWKRYKNYPFYTWQDTRYMTFMRLFLMSLEVRRYEAKEFICTELMEVQEITFVTSGKYDVGYELNKVLKLRL